MDDLHSWWEVPAIAHFFSLFKSCFSLSDFTIEELEEALLTDGDDEKSTYFVSRLLMELLQGYYDNTNITITTCHDWLRRIMMERWEEDEGRINPLASVEANFHELPLRLKIQIIHRITEYRLDAKDVESKLQGLNATDLRLEPLGFDRHGAKFWYFFGVRLYKELPVEETSQDVKSLSKKKKKRWKRRFNSFHPACHWSVACYSVSDWQNTADRMKGTDSRRERALVQLITENFLPNLPKIVEDMEHQKVLKLQAEPRRSSDRLLARKLCEAELEAEKKCALERAEKVRKEREEREKNRCDVTTVRMKRDFEKMLRLEMERKWKDVTSRLQTGVVKDYELSSGDERVTLEGDLDPATPNKAGKRKVHDNDKNSKRQKITKATDKKWPRKSKRNSEASQNGGWLKKTGIWGKAKKNIPTDSDEDADLSSEDNQVDEAAMRKVFLDVQAHPEAWQFEAPVDEAIAPGYHSIIKRPMDLSEVDRKLGCDEYESPQDFVLDMTLMFNNCRLYNGPESEYTQVADEIDELFRGLVKRYLPHVPIDDVIYKPVYADVTQPANELKKSSDELSTSSVDSFSFGTTTRAAWRSNISTTSQAQIRRPRGRGRGKARGRGRGLSNRGRARGRVRRGQRLSKRISSQQSACDKSEASEEVEQKDYAQNINEKSECEKRSSSSSSRNSSPERGAKVVAAEAKPQNVWSLDFLASQARVLEEQQQQQKPQRDEIEAKSRNSDGESKSLETPPKPKSDTNPTSRTSVQNNSPKVTAQSPAQPSPSNATEASPTGAKSPPMDKAQSSVSPNGGDTTTEDIYDFKEDDQHPPNRHRGGRNSVIAGLASPKHPFPMTPAPVYPMTPGYPADHSFQSPTLPSKRHSLESESPSTPSSGYGSYNQTGRSSTPCEGAAIVNPPTPKLDSSPEKSVWANPKQAADSETQAGSVSDNGTEQTSSLKATSPDGNVLTPTTVRVSESTTDATNRPPEIRHEPEASPANETRIGEQEMRSSNDANRYSPVVPHHDLNSRAAFKAAVAHPAVPSCSPSMAHRQSVPTTSRTHRSQSNPQHQTYSVSGPGVPSHTAPQRSLVAHQNQRAARTQAPRPQHVPSSRIANVPDSAKTAARDANRASCPDYGSIGTADRYSQSTAERGYERYGSSHLTPKSATPMASPTMASLGLNWSVGNSSDQRKNSSQGRSSLAPSGAATQESRSKARLKQTPSSVPRATPRNNMPQYPADYMGYPFSAHHSSSAHDFPAQQNGLLSAATNSPLLHSDLTASATLRVLQQQQQQHKPTDIAGHAGGMFLPTGHYPSAAAQSQADQYNRLAATAAAQQHQLNMYHQTSNAQNPWLQLHPSQMDPVYQLMQQHGQYPMYPNLLHKYQ